MTKYRIDIYKKLSKDSLAKPIFFRSQFVSVKNIKELKLVVSLLGSYQMAPFDSKYEFISEDGAIKLYKYRKKLERYTAYEFYS